MTARRTQGARVVAFIEQHCVHHSARSLGSVFGVHGKTVVRWVRCGWLRGVVTEWGVYITGPTLYAEAERVGLLPAVQRIAQFVPSAWFLPVLAPLFPAAAQEVGLLARAL